MKLKKKNLKWTVVIYLFVIKKKNNNNITIKKRNLTDIYL